MRTLAGSQGAWPVLGPDGLPVHFGTVEASAFKRLVIPEPARARDPDPSPADRGLTENRWEFHDGLTKEVLVSLAKDLGPIRQSVAGVTGDEIEHMSPSRPALPPSRSKPCTAVAASVSKADVRARQPAAIATLSAGVLAAMRPGGMACEDNAPLALAALRLQRFRLGERSLDPERIRRNAHKFPKATLKLCSIRPPSVAHCSKWSLSHPVTAARLSPRAQRRLRSPLTPWPRSEPALGFFYRTAVCRRFSRPVASSAGWRPCRRRG